MVVYGSGGDGEGKMTEHLGTTLMSKALELDAYSMGCLVTETQIKGA